MIKLENYEVLGWEHAIRGMRNPMNSWEKSDSKMINQVLGIEEVCPGVERTFWKPCVPFIDVGKNDHELMMKLANAGPVHGKFRRMITVYVDITAPLYWWKEFDTYKVGTVANSCSTMHKIHAKEFTREDFSCEHLMRMDEQAILYNSDVPEIFDFSGVMDIVVEALNNARKYYLETKDKKYWWQMIQLLPSSYNQRRTVELNYEVLANIYQYRKNHKLDEWKTLCSWIEELPYSEIITGDLEGTDEPAT